MTDFIGYAKTFIQSEDAPTMVEYGLLVALIAIIVAAGASTLGLKCQQRLQPSSAGQSEARSTGAGTSICPAQSLLPASPATAIGR